MGKEPQPTKCRSWDREGGGWLPLCTLRDNNRSDKCLRSNSRKGDRIVNVAQATPLHLPCNYSSLPMRKHHHLTEVRSLRLGEDGRHSLLSYMPEQC